VLMEERIIRHLSQTLSATRAELKALARLSNDGQFDAFISEVRLQHPASRSGWGGK
jgi:3-methyladenine DNA glycosylase Tag